MSYQDLVRRRLFIFSTGVKSIPICGAGGVPHVDCVPHRELNDTVISHIFHNLSFVIYVKILSKVSLYKKLMALLPASEGCAKEEGSLSTTQVGNAICKKRRLSLLQVINSLGDFKPLVEQASVENLLRLVGMRYRQNITKSHFLNRCFFLYLQEPGSSIETASWLGRSRSKTCFEYCEWQSLLCGYVIKY